MRCPYCQLNHPPGVARCVCGTALVPSPTSTAATPSPEARTWASAVHLAALAGVVLPLGSVLGPLVVWLVRRKDSPFIDAHGRSAVNFQMTMAIFQVGVLALIVSSVFAITGEDGGSNLIGSILLFGAALIALAMVSLGFAVVGSIRASGGREYRYPLAIPFFRAARVVTPTPVTASTVKPSPPMAPPAAPIVASSVTATLPEQRL